MKTNGMDTPVAITNSTFPVSGDESGTELRMELAAGVDPFGKSLERKSLPRPNWLPKSVWPFDTFALNVDGIDLAVTDVGSGPTLLLVHIGAWSFIWRDLMIRLAGDFRCVCFDAPGSGRSDPLPASQTTLERAARAASGVIQELNLTEFTLVAHDLGGTSGLAAVAAMPERVRGIVAMNTFGWRPSGAAFRGMLRIMGGGMIREIDAATNFIARIASTSFGVGRHMDAASRVAFRTGTAAQGRRAFHYYMRDARRCDALYEKIRAALTGPLAQQPMLTMFGERNDPFHFQREWKELFPDAVELVISKGNHFPMCDAPDTVAKAIRSWHAIRVTRR